MTADALLIETYCELVATKEPRADGNATA